MGAHTN